nr:penicillin-binding protein 2 [Psychromicrobium sp. YIM S02556]
MLVLMLVVSGKLLLVQGLNVGDLAQAAVAQRTMVQTLPATRGEILDSNGKILAQTILRYRIVVDQQNNGAASANPFKRPNGAGGSEEVSRDTGIAELASALGKSQDEVRAAVTGSARYNIVATGVTPEVEDHIASLRIPGISAEATPVRSYPMGQVGGNVVGFINSDGTGSGLEYTMNQELTGTDGSRTYQKGKDGIIIPTAPIDTKAAVNGGTIKTTINADLQYFAQQAISDQVKKLHADWGNIVVVQVKTGNIVALAEDTTVDPNNPGATPAASRDSRAVTNAIEPGSTEKSVTAAGAIQEGKASPSTQLVIQPTYTVGGQTFSDSFVHGTVNRTFAGVIGQSMNTGTVMIGERLTPQQRYDYLRKFGIGQTTGIPLPGEAKGILATPDQWDGRQEYTVLFGQGVSQTPLQTAMIYQALANNGVRLQPRLIDSVTDSNGVEHKMPQAPGTETVSPDAAKQVRDMLESAITMQHYNDVVVPGYRVGGKTGTAESPVAGGFNGYTASFAGMAPMDDPQYVVLVTVQHPQGNIYGITQGPVFNAVMGQVLHTEAVPPSTEPPVKLPQDF